MTTRSASARSASAQLELRNESDRTGDQECHESGMKPPRAPGYQGLLQRLSEEQRSALLGLAHDPPRQSVPRTCAVRLMQLGLAELDCGRLLLTRAGRNAVVAMSDQ